MSDGRSTPALLLLVALAASPVAAQDVTLHFGSGVSDNNLPYHWAMVDEPTFDIAAGTLTVRASFRIRTVADRAAGRFRTVVCRYRNRSAVSEGSTHFVYWVDCGGGMTEPQTFERLEGVTATILENGRTYRMGCESLPPGSGGALIPSDGNVGLSFVCWLAGTTPTRAMSPSGEAFTLELSPRAVRGRCPAGEKDTGRGFAKGAQVTRSRQREKT